MKREPSFPDAETRRLDAALQEWIASAPAGFQVHGADAATRYGITREASRQLEMQFETLALDLFVYQFERVPLYRAYARARGRTPSQVRRAIDVPALPVEALRRGRVAGFPQAHETLRFHTSGTTGRPGVLHLDSANLYELTLERGFAHHVVPDVERMRMALLVPSLEEAPHSSLGYMLERVRRRWGSAQSATYVKEGALCWPALRKDLEEAASSREPLCLLGTTFAVVGLLETAAKEGWRSQLPPGSRVFETGGTKGRTRELSRRELLHQLEETLGVPQDFVVSEYGMTELASQYYTLSLRLAVLGIEAPTDAAIWSAPFWLRPRIMDAESGHCDELDGAAALGLLTHHDLGNRSTVAHWLTADLAEPHGGSFLLRGRAPRAEARGCGLAQERLVAGDEA